jgi:hypothetical protein
MKLLTGLKCPKPTQGNWREVRANVQCVSDSPVPGFIRTAHLGSAGITLKRGDKVLAIPLAELFALAESVEPAFRPPGKAVMAALPAALNEMEKSKV